MTELLVEAFSEEIPARMQKRAAEDLGAIFTSKLKEAGLSFEQLRHFITPRRIVVMVEGLPLEQPTLREERRGPRVDSPPAALEGFLRSNGVSREEIEERETQKGIFYFAEIKIDGKPTSEILPEIVEEALRQLPWQKSMRWGRNSFRWVRPLHHVLAVFDGQVLDGTLNLGDEILKFTNKTVGHRFLSPEIIQVSSFADYNKQLKTSYVIIDREERKLLIQKGAEKLASQHNVQLRQDEALLEEVCGLVEWPNILLGVIDSEFLEVPSEALVSAMRSHQKYFALETPRGDLAPYFITVSNMPFDEKRDLTIITGNEKVLRARLSDARFFWNQDLEIRLESREVELKKINFFDKLGSLGEKSIRMQNLARNICQFVPKAQEKDAVRAAKLAKADLSTAMVNEFPELQGVMGGYYARADGEQEHICAAVAGHYAPQGPSDVCPNAPLTIVAALADKLDTLVGFFAINEKPTGSKDPFALRRAALGIIRLIIENKLRAPLSKLIAMSLKEYPDLENTNGLLEFINERSKIYLKGEGVRQDLISAIFSAGREDDLCRLIARVKALENFLKTDDGASLLVAHRRAANIVSIEEKKDNVSYTGDPNPQIFEVKEEQIIGETLRDIRTKVEISLASEEFEDAMQALASLRKPLDDYFEKVIVNSEKMEVRRNRLESLALIGVTMDSVADFSMVEN